MQEKTSSKYIIVAAAFAAFLATFNETFLNVGFTPIGNDFGIGLDTVQWLSTAYMLVAAVMVPIAAFAYRSFRTRQLYCATVCFLIAGSVIGFFAPNFSVLLAGRIVQAIGTGMLIPLNMTITLDTAPREKLGTYMGIMGSMTTLGPSLSVIFAGVLLSLFTWRALMAMFFLLSVACFIVGFVVLRDVAEITKPKMDVASVILIGIGLIGLLYGISSIFSGYLLVAFACIIIGLLLIGAFGKRQFAIENPLVDLRPLKSPAFVIGVLLNMIALIIMFAMNIITPTFLQSALGMGSLIASLTLFPAILLSSVVSPIAGRIYDKTGPRILLPAGFVCISAFSVILALFISSGNIILLAVLYIPIICGCALVIGPVQSFALSHLSWELNPHGTTIMSVGFQVAGALGSSLFTGVYYLGLNGGLAGGLSMIDAGAHGFLMAGIMALCFGVVAIILSIIEGRFYKPSAKATAWSSDNEETQSTHSPFRIADVMNEDVFTVSENSTALFAMKMFLEKGISGAPVISETGELYGIVTDGDIMRFLANQHSDFKGIYTFALEIENGHSDAHLNELVNMKVKDLCTQKCVTIDIASTLGDLCQAFAEHRYNKMPVTKDGQMVGVINRVDVTRYIVSNYLEDM